MNKLNKNPKAHAVELIRTELERRGSGADRDPSRVIEQFWTLDGKLAAENDPSPPSQLSCKAIMEILQDRKLGQAQNILELPEAVASALDSLQNLVDKQKESISKLQEKVQECQAETDSTNSQKAKKTG